LYFIVKNHPFNDGKNEVLHLALFGCCIKQIYNYSAKINPETLTTLTLLIAETSPSDKDKMIGVVQLLLTT